MSDDLVDLDIFFKQNNKSPNILNDSEVKLLLDGINDTKPDNTSADMIDLYQAQGIKNTNTICLTRIGKCVDRPSINIGKFDFNNYKCHFVSYLLADIDLVEATNNGYLNLISLHILRETETIGIISLEFHTFKHIKEHRSIQSMIGEIINGTFEIFFKTCDNKTGYINKIHLGSLKHFPDKRNLIYIMLKYLSHNDVKHVFK